MVIIEQAIISNENGKPLMLAQNNLIETDDYYLAGNTPALLADIYQEHVQLINWQRELASSIKNETEHLLQHRSSFKFRIVIPPEQVAVWLRQQWRTNLYDNLAQDVEMLATLYADLFEVSQVGLRFELIDKTMCPFFHVDKVMCRLMTNYSGLTTEWVTDSNTDRQALINHKYEDIVIDSTQINHVDLGDVLLFKGQRWSENEGEGVVHRSSEATPDQRRLILTLDIV